MKGRPDYTNEAIEEVGRVIRESIEGNDSFAGLKKNENLKLSDMKILELGAGTGKNECSNEPKFIRLYNFRHNPCNNSFGDHVHIIFFLLLWLILSRFASFKWRQVYSFALSFRG